MEQRLKDFEKEFSCVLTLHDYRGLFFKNEKDFSIDWKRFSHRQQNPVCAQTNRSYCIDRCMNQVNKRILRRREECFIKKCKSGVIEVVAPVFMDHTHVATFFAGVWTWRKGRKDLPRVSHDKIYRLLRLLPLFAVGFIEKATQQRRLHNEEFNRKTEIRNFITENACRDVRLSELAQKLGLSQSRACHLISECFGKPFRILLSEERMERARVLLISSNYRINEIASMAGFNSVEHFSRTFRNYNNISPGEYRRRYQLHFD